jgi:glycosyltransferase involved in cell wall biosynthesis
LAVGHAPILRVNRILFRKLRDLGWNIALAVPEAMPADWPNRPTPEPRAPEDPPIHYLPLRGDSVRSFTLPGLAELMRTERPRIVYLQNEPTSVQAHRLAALCRATGSTLVINTNENDIPPLGEAWRRGAKIFVRSLWKRVWSRPVSRHAWVAAICEDGRAAMRASGFAPERIIVTPLGFDASLFFRDPGRRAQWREKLGLTQPTIAYFGRMAANKGIHLLIEALGVLRAQPWQFLIDSFEHAPDDYAQVLRTAYERAAIDDRTQTVNPSHEEIADFMRACDIVVIPSTWREQYGRVAPEAMACGCAVIVADIGALPELVGSSGVVVPPHDSAAIAAAISALIADGEHRAALGEAAAERARKDLSADSQAILLDGFFKKILAE